MSTILYLCSNQYSGSTLLSFLLNTHPKIATVGHTKGWRFGEDEEFRCSCGALLEECTFYGNIASAFEEEGLPFDIRDFGTAYRVSSNDRINRLVTASLPFVGSSRAERLRDALVQRIPGLASVLDRGDAANRIFMTSVLNQTGADVFLDNSQDPYRLRHLSRLSGFEVKVVHLIREPRGVVLSMMNHLGWDAGLAARLWLRRELDIVRITTEYDDTVRVHYEDLCESTDTALAEIHAFVGLTPLPFSGDFKASEHHILGNVMRLRDGKVRLDSRWETELAPQNRARVERTLGRFVRKHPQDPCADVIRHYLSV